MADRKDDESDDRERDELDEPEGTGTSNADAVTAKPGSVAPKPAPKAKPSDDDEEEEDETSAADESAADESAADESAETEGDDLAARTAEEAESDEDEILPTQLGTQRYVFAAFFGGVMIFAYVLGKLVHGVWGWASNREWFYGRFPGVAAVPDDSKTVYGLVIGSFIALLLGIRTYRKPDVRRWTDEVTSEMTKVKWPTRKEVYGSTVVVIAGSLIACAYLFLLDQFWSFVTGLVYGTGS